MCVLPFSELYASSSVTCMFLKATNLLRQTAQTALHSCAVLCCGFYLRLVGVGRPKNEKLSFVMRCMCA